MNFIWFIIIGILAGWLAGKIMNTRKRGVMMNLVIGVVGSLLGGLLSMFLDIHAGGLIGELVLATVGAVLLIFLLRKL